MAKAYHFLIVAFTVITLMAAMWVTAPALTGSVAFASEDVHISMYSADPQTGYMVIQGQCAELDVANNGTAAQALDAYNVERRNQGQSEFSPAPECKGYRFTGWYTFEWMAGGEPGQVKLVEPFDLNTPLTADSSITGVIQTWAPLSTTADASKTILTGSTDLNKKSLTSDSVSNARSTADSSPQSGDSNMLLPIAMILLLGASAAGGFALVRREKQ